MSFTSTFNSLSARGFGAGSASGSGSYALSANIGNFEYSQQAINPDGNFLAIQGNSQSFGGNCLIYKINSGIPNLQTTLNANIGNASLFDTMSFSYDGNYFLSGGFAQDSGNFTNNGLVRVWIKSGNTWVTQQDISGVANNDLFGKVSVIDNDGQRFLACGSLNPRIYNRSGNSWSLEANIQPVGNLVIFDGDMDANGTVIGIGYPEYSNNQGKVEIYNRSNTTWSLTTTLYGSNINAYSFGRSLKIHPYGNLIAISEPDANVGNISNVGQVYIFSLISNTWTQTQILTPDPFYQQDFFGGIKNMIDIGNSFLTIGSNNFTPNVGFAPGTIFTYQLFSGNYVFQDILYNPIANSTNFGTSISISENAQYLTTFVSSNSTSKLLLYSQ